MRIALSTGGGDAPGLNAVIRAVVLAAVNRGWEVLGVKKGYAGLLGEEEVISIGGDGIDEHRPPALRAWDEDRLRSEDDRQRCERNDHDIRL